MKTLLVLILVVFVVFVVINGLRRDRGSALRRQFPGPDPMAGNTGADDSFLYTAGASGSEPVHHHHAGQQVTDCTPSHDAGGSCSMDSGGGGHH
jgi:hypothetical protein